MYVAKGDGMLVANTLATAADRGRRVVDAGRLMSHSITTLRVCSGNLSGTRARPVPHN